MGIFPPESFAAKTQIHDFSQQEKARTFSELEVGWGESPAFTEFRRKTSKRILTSPPYLERGFQLRGCSCEQKLNNDAEWNYVPQRRAAGHLFTRLEEQGSK